MIGTFYASLFFAIGIMLHHPHHGLINTNVDVDRPLGYISYSAVESFGSLGMSVFGSLQTARLDWKINGLFTDLSRRLDR